MSGSSLNHKELGWNILYLANKKDKIEGVLLSLWGPLTIINAAN